MEGFDLGEGEPFCFSYIDLIFNMSSIVDQEDSFLFPISDNRIDQDRRVISRECDRIVSYDLSGSNESILTKRERVIESATDELIFVGR